MRSFLIAIVVFFLSLPAIAAVDGEDAPDFQIAKQAWLDGQDDVAALKLLGDLARQENLAAQLLLGLIRRGNGTQPDVDHLNSKERRALFNRMDRRFGTPWLRIAAKRHPLAKALTQRNHPDWALYVQTLADAGQIERAYVAAGLPLNRDNDHIATMELLMIPSLRPYAAAALWDFADDMAKGHRRFGATDKADAIERIRNGLPQPDFADLVLTFEPGAFLRPDALITNQHLLRMRGAALLHHPDLVPLSHVISKACPKDPAFAFGVLFHTRPLVPIVFFQLSPTAPVITHQEWQNARRFHRDTLQRFVRIGPSGDMQRKLIPCLFAATEKQ